MKPLERKPEIIYRIIDNTTGEVTGSYSRACCNEYDFRSAEEARSANCHNMFQDRKKYNIAKYKVTYELLDPDSGSDYPYVMYIDDNNNIIYKRQLNFKPKPLKRILLSEKLLKNKIKFSDFP